MTNGETETVPGMVRWRGEGNEDYFLKDAKGDGATFELGYEIALGMRPGEYAFITSIAFNTSEAADLIQHIAEFTGLDVVISPKP